MALITLTGTANWFKGLFEADTKFDEEGIYSFEFIPDNASLQSFKDSGSRLKIQDNGGIRLRRKAPEGAPEVLFEGKPWDSENMVGNGSAVTVVIDVYPSRMGKGTRLEAVRIDELVEFDESEIKAKAIENTKTEALGLLS
jgi:hypothetical protein